MDKTGTITLGNRQATELIPAPGVSDAELLPTPRRWPRSPMRLLEGALDRRAGQGKYGLRGRPLSSLEAIFIPFTAQTRMSGVDFDGRRIRKGAPGFDPQVRDRRGGSVPTNVDEVVQAVASSGATPLLVATENRILGTVRLKDIAKGAECAIGSTTSAPWVSAR